MSAPIDNGGPAFPTENARQTGPSSWHEEGMTLRQYAAIKLRVPDSGTDWLDEMIRASQRDEFAAKAMQPLIAGRNWNHFEGDDQALIAQWARSSYVLADAMLAARQGSAA